MLQTRASNATNQSENTEKPKKFTFSGTLNSLGTIDRLPEFRFRWNTNEEVFTILTSSEQHKNWIASDVKIRPPNGSLLLYNRNNLKTRSYHNDKYFWKTRKNSKSSARVDHSSLRIRGIECIYCSYVHSALVSTFHRRCYWLLENPDIVLVHYLNIPDKKTTFDDLVTSLLPYKTLTEHELLCQLQPILSSGEDERNNNKALQVDVDKLVAEVRQHKEPKTKGRGNQKKTSGSSKKVTASSTVPKPAETTSTPSQSLDKCTNCNRFYTTISSTATTSSRTNVAVTINRQTGRTSRTKRSVSDPNYCTPISFTTESTVGSTAGHILAPTGSVVEIPSKLPPANTVQHVTGNESILKSGLIGLNHSEHVYPCNDLLQGSVYSVASHKPGSTIVHGRHGYTNLPITSDADTCMLDSDMVVLDYDGMNLVQSDQVENDFTKVLMNESDVNLFDNDLLSYLPDYLPEVNQFQTNLQNVSELMPAVQSVTTTQDHVRTGIPCDNVIEGTPCKQVIPNQISLSSHPHHVQQSNITNTAMVHRSDRTLYSPTEMISTDCHTFNNLTPSLLQSGTNVDGLLPSTHQCSTNGLSLEADLNIFQMGVPGVIVADMDMTQMSLPEGCVCHGVNPSATHTNVLYSSVHQGNIVNVCTSVEALSSLPQPGPSRLNVSTSTVEAPQKDVLDKDVSGLHETDPSCISPVRESLLPKSKESLSSAEAINANTTSLNALDVSAVQSNLSQGSVSLVQSMPGVQTSVLGGENGESRIVNDEESPPNVSVSQGTSAEGSADLHATNVHSENIITEFSPEWSYCDGKTKVLILGDWSRPRHNGSYSCLFDGCSVSATLIQPGVLRCFCPPHDPGMVSLQVAWNGFIISNACVFEYKMRENAANSASDWLGANDEDLKKLILERVERLESILGLRMSPAVTEGEVGEIDGELGTVEDRVVRICEVLLKQPRACQFLDAEPGPKGLTLLHLAAGLGYTKLIRFLQSQACAEKSRNMGTNNQGTDVLIQTADVREDCADCSPRAKDSFGFIPLMWACWRGHEDAAMTLLAWQPLTYSDCDQSGRTAKTIAQEMGHVDLVRQMEEFMCGEDMYSLVMESSPQSPSSSCAYLSVSSNECVPQSPMSADSLVWERVERVNEPSLDFEMASMISEERPNTLGKVLVEIRTLIQEAEERARSPLHTPNNSAPFSLGFTGFSDLPSEEGTSENLLTSDSEFGPRSSHYDTLSIDSSPMLTPSSHSPGSPGMRNSPQSTGTDTSEFEEFLSKPRQFLERDFSELTLTDIEQQELLQAAKVIQNAYRQFKIRKKQHIDELKAAVLIQSYYRRYKQFALYKRITKAAVLIQNSYRAHKEHEQFKRSRHAAAVIQTYFRHYRKRKQKTTEDDAPGKRMETKYRKPSYEK